MRLFIPAYLPSIAYTAALLQVETYGFYGGGNYQKQTFRNRCNIHGANGLLHLTVPIVHQKKGSKQKDSEVQIFHESRWKKEHWKSLEAAYRSSPYFEFYEDDFAPYFNSEESSLLEFNLQLLERIFQVLGIEFQKTLLNDLPEGSEIQLDYLNAKTPLKSNHFPPYHQVFENKNGFIPNLSVIDLLFNLGPETEQYLRTIPLPA